MTKRLPPALKERKCATNMKRTYRTRARALMCAARIAKGGGGQLYPYKCPGCRQWHLTSQEPS